MIPFIGVKDLNRIWTIKWFTDLSRRVKMVSIM
jgi:hypothetical protein